MTDYGTLRLKVGRKPFTIGELDLDTCGNVYGTAPCAAAVGTTGTARCYNTFGTCQDKGNFNKQVKTYRLCERTSFLPIGENAMPCITSFDVAPTRIEPQGLSLRANVQVVCQDFTIHDRGVDPYVTTRAAPAQGTFFGRLLRRNPHVQNRVMRVKSGYIDSDRAVYSETHTYLIESIAGPDANGRVTIKAKDILKIGDDETAQAPKPSKGKLTADMGVADTFLAITPDSALADYPTSGIVRLGDEVITYSSKTTNGLQGLLRGQRDTTAVTHKAGDRVQLCVEYVNQSPAAILNDLLVNYAACPGGYIPLSSWQDECDTWLPFSLFSALITEPTGVNKLLGEVLDASYANLWWEEVESLIKFKVTQVPLPSTLPKVLTDAANLLAGQTKVEPQERYRITRVETYYKLQHASDDVKIESMRILSTSIDTDAESVNAYNSPTAKKLVSRWIPNETVAEDVNFHYLARFGQAPRQVSFRLDAKDNTLRTGQLADVYTRVAQNAEGVSGGVRVLVIERHEEQAGTYWDYVGLEAGEVGQVAMLLADDTTPDWDAASAADRAEFMYLADETQMLDGIYTTRLLY